MRAILVFGIPLVAALSPGCVELGLITPISLDGTPDGFPSVDTPDTDSPTLATVSLSVSNPTPQINEEVTLTCRVTNGAVDGVTFAFDGAPGRLIIDRNRGTASFITQESDAGVAFNFTCTATNDVGTGPRSAARLVIVSSM